jgi:hypothetical protein
MASTPLLLGEAGVNAMTQPAPPAIASALLSCRDPNTIEQVTHAMEKLAIATDVCVDIAAARHILKKKKFDAIAVDFDLDEDAPGLLGDIRTSPSNRTAPAIAIVRNRDEVALAHYAGTNFIFQRPLTNTSVNRTLCAGYGLIMRERRRYFRCPLRARIWMRRVDMSVTSGHIVNLSEGGIEISSAPPQLIPGAKVHVEFVLPGSNARFSAACEVRWRNAKNHAGLQFLLMPLDQRCDLQEWLRQKLEESLPESVAEKFRDANERFLSEA